MPFMEPQITAKIKWVRADGIFTVFCPLEDWEAPPGDTSKEVWTDSEYLKPGEYTVETIEGYGARMSAPGYLDCTEWSVFSTEEEARAYLQETFGLNIDLETYCGPCEGTGTEIDQTGDIPCEYCQGTGIEA
jgi:hypothetical protein